MKVDLYPHQTKALSNMHNGCILSGGVGSGKSITALTYFFTKVMGGGLILNGAGETHGFSHPNITKLLIITPAKKKRDLEWDKECSRFGLGKDPAVSFGAIEVIIDSWHSITKYVDITNAFVIFDEQKLIGSGAWVKAFYKIAKSNPWIVLSATPGDTWMDFIPVFVANGYYRNKTEFTDRHVVYNRYSKFPKVDRYVEEGRLNAIRHKILVEMPFRRHTTRHVLNEMTTYNEDIYKQVNEDRWNPWSEEPIKNAAEWIQILRRVVNSDESRLFKLAELMEKHNRMIVFYSFSYELDMLRDYLSLKGATFSEWNGQKHQEIPDTDSWLYLVQYTAGNDGWNCITTDAMVFFSLQYSYKVYEQCQGRIDRLNTPYSDLYYYVMRSNSNIDHAIWKALVKKKTFSEKVYTGSMIF